MGLLCLRLGAAIALFHDGVARLVESPHHFLWLLIDAAAGLFLCAGLWTPIAGGSGDSWVVGRLLAFRGSLEPHTIGNTGRWAGYARTWHLVRRCPPLWKKAHQNSGPVDLSSITLNQSISARHKPCRSGCPRRICSSITAISRWH